MLTRSPDGAQRLPKTAMVFDPSPEAIAAVRAHPRFDTAMRASALTGVELYRGNRLVNAVASDRGRFLLAIMALYLHETRDPADPGSGLTVARLQELAERTGACSAGRAKAMIALMRWAGYLAPAPSEDRRVKRLAPTPRLAAMHVERWRRQIQAASFVRPDLGVLAASPTPAFWSAFAREFGAQYEAGYRILDAAPELGLFAERNAGLLVLLSLVVAGGIHRPVPVSVSALAAAFCVSRAHVTGLLRDAEAVGLLERDGAYLALGPDLAEGVEAFFARALLFVARCVELGAAGAAASPEADALYA